MSSSVSCEASAIRHEPGDLEIEWTAEGFRIVPRQVTDTIQASK